MKGRIEKFMEDLNSVNIENLQKWFNDESTVWIPPTLEVVGKGRILALFRAIFRKYHDIEWRILEIIPVSDTRYFYTTFSLGKLTNGQAFENHICTDIIFSEKGEIIKLSDFFKNVQVIQK